ncbi:MAG: PorT family protein [Bacteroidota bacterium]|nr:PorT family protein [Bacteroidota bacterium]
MKKLIVLFYFLFLTGITYAQLTIGPKIGLNSSKIILEDNTQGVSDGNRKLGFHVGAFGRSELGILFVQPEILYTTSRGEINVDVFGINQIQEYKFNQIDVPVMIGFKFLPMLRVFGGPVATFLIGADGTEGALKNYKNATLGYQLGIGIDFGNLILDLKYEDNFSKFGDAINIGAQRYAIDQRQNQILLGLGIRLFD